MSKAYIYEPLPEGAKPAAWWWAIVQVILMFLIAIAVAVIGAILTGMIAAAVAILNGSWDPVQTSEPPGWIIGVTVAGAMLSLFIGLALTAVIKVKMEKRSLASAGMNGFLYGPRFWAGFLGGIGIALLLIIPASLFGADSGLGEPEAAFVVDRVLTGQFGLILLGLLVFLMVQAPAEEIFIRGWMLSALAWRHGIVTALIVSSLVFALLHGDRIVAGPMWLLYTFISVGAIGVLFAGVAYAARSVLPAAGMHTGYNFTLISGALAYVAGTSEDGDVLAALMQAIDINNLPPFEFSASMILDLLVRGLVPVAIAVWLFRRKRGAA